MDPTTAQESHGAAARMTRPVTFVVPMIPPVMYAAPMIRLGTFAVLTIRSVMCAAPTISQDRCGARASTIS